MIGGFFGNGNNVTTFNLPDLRGRFVRGVDDEAGRDPDANSRGASAEGGNTGDKVGSAQDDAIKSHSHPMLGTGWVAKGDPSQIAAKMGSSPGNKASADDTEKTGGSETRPKNIYVNWIIKAKDV